jgi:conjugative relaxase-like TrwC/TraI family protein
MLSIAKLAAGGQRYYLDQAKGRVSHEVSVASGVEDYYLSGPEPAGRWVGSVAERDGFAGEVVADEQLHRALSWADPRTGEDLEGPVQHARVPGFDLMFSVPKSASILMAVGGPQVQLAVRDAQAVAVGEAMRYLEKTAART